jgi:hypothetical protein
MTMKTYRNSYPAPYGLYFSAGPLDMTFVSADGEVLDGKTGATYRRVPSLLAVLLSPVLGGFFVLAFPLVVLAAVAYAIAHFAARPVRRLAERHANLARVRWEPATSYLHGSEGEGGGEGEGEGDESEVLAALEQEVQARREQEDEREPKV